MDPIEIAAQMGDKRVTPDLIALLKASIREQLPAAKIIAHQDGSFHVFHGRSGLEVRETRDDRLALMGVAGTVGVYDDAYRAMGAMVTFFNGGRL
jgi:hypothetical protein